MAATNLMFCCSQLNGRNVLPDACWKTINNVMSEGSSERCPVGTSRTDIIEKKGGGTGEHNRKIKIRPSVRPRYVPCYSRWSFTSTAGYPRQFEVAICFPSETSGGTSGFIELDSGSDYLTEFSELRVIGDHQVMRDCLHHFPGLNRV